MTDEPDEDDGAFLEDVDQEAMMKAVLQAGMALQDRLQRLEVRHGSVGLIFLTDMDAALIERVIERERRRTLTQEDLAHMRVLSREMRTFIEGMEHEIGEVDPPDG